MNSPQGCFYEFGPFRLDPAKRLLSRDGESVPLKPKVFETLLILVEAQGQVLEKDELMKRIWPDSIVEENNLNVYVSQLRKALGESPDQHPYIVTIPGRGYRFVAELRITHTEDEKRTEGAPAAPESQRETPDPEIPTPLPATADSAQRNGRRRSVVLILTAALVLTLGAGLGLGRLRSKRSAAAFHSVKLNMLTETGNILDAAISPDGKYVAYVQVDAGKQSLRLRQTYEEGGPTILPPSEVPYAHLIFSPDGASLYFVMWDGKTGSNTLYQLPVLGGVARKIIAGVNSAIAFSPDGSRLAFVRDYREQQESVLMTAGVDGMAEQRLAVCKNPDSLLVYLSGPAWSPDGSVIVSPMVIKAGGMHVELLEVRVSDGAQKTITKQHWGYIGRLSWSPNGDGLVMTATEQGAGNPQLWHLSWPAGTARRISQDLTRYNSLSVTDDARALVTVQTEELTSLWVAPSVEPSRVVKIASGSNDTFSGLGWTPDGKIIYASSQFGSGNLWLTNVDGSQQQLLVTEAVNHSPAASPDGRYIVFVSNRNGQINVWRVDHDGRNPVQLTHGNYDHQPRCSPDGKWVVYMARGGAPSSALLKVSIEGGAPVQLAEKIVGLPGISPDGKWIAYHLQSNPWKLAVAAFAGGPPVSVFENLDYSARWAPDGRALTWVKTSSGVSNLWSQPLAGGPPKQITNFGVDQFVDFAWSPDGRQLAFRRRVTSSNIVLINNVRQ